MEYKCFTILLAELRTTSFNSALMTLTDCLRTELFVSLKVRISKAEQIMVSAKELIKRAVSQMINCQKRHRRILEVGRQCQL